MAVWLAGQSCVIRELKDCGRSIQKSRCVGVGKGGDLAEGEHGRTIVLGDRVVLCLQVRKVHGGKCWLIQRPQ